MNVKQSIGAISKLAWALIRHKEAMSWGDAFRAAMRLLSRRGWMTIREGVAKRLAGMGDVYRAMGEAGRALAFSNAAWIAKNAASFAAFTKASGVGQSLRREAAAAALPYGSRRMEDLTCRRGGAWPLEV